MCQAQMTIWAATSKEAAQELLNIALEVGQVAVVISVYPQRKHNWLVTYRATAEAIRKMEEWVS